MSEIVTKRVVITGGRNYDDHNMVDEVLDLFNPTELYVGDARGADTLAREWAESRGKTVRVFSADWQKHGRAAGPIRNKDMLYEAGPDATVIAFPGGAGTDNCVHQAVAMNLIVLRVQG